MAFIDLATVPEFEMLPGVRLRTPHGRNIMLSYVTLDDGAAVPTHSHPHEQAGIIVSGQLEMTIAGETRVLGPGGLYIIPADVPHAARPVGGPAVVLDIFSPIREDYAQRLNSYVPAGDRV